MGPPIQLFTTSIVMQPVLRQRQEYLLRTLQIRKIPHTVYDLSSDEDAKRLWRRKAPSGKTELPGILVGGACPGLFAQFEEAVEFDELDSFLRVNESYDPELDMMPAMPQQAIGVPGAVLPSQTTPIKSASVSPAQPSKSTSSAKPKQSSIDADLDDIQVTEDEIAQLLESMGLENKEAKNEATKVEEDGPPPTTAGHLGSEVAKIAQQRLDAKKASKNTGRPDSTKPLALRKASAGDAPATPDDVGNILKVE